MHKYTSLCPSYIILHLFYKNKNSISKYCPKPGTPSAAERIKEIILMFISNDISDSAAFKINNAVIPVTLFRKMSFNAFFE